MTALVKRFGPLVLLLAIALGAWASGVLDSLTPTGFARREAEISLLTASHPFQALMIFVGVYALLTAACLPVALVLTLLGGYLFGTWPATLALIVAATLSSLLTYGAARSALSPWLMKRLEAGGRMADIVANIRRETFFYVLSLRFVPVAPFGAVNAAAGVARAPVGPYLAATVLGVAPACLIYAGLGAGLHQTLGQGPFDLHKASVTPGLLWPLAGLGALSLVTGWLRGRDRRPDAS